MKFIHAFKIRKIGFLFFRIGVGTVILCTFAISSILLNNNFFDFSNASFLIS